MMTDRIRKSCKCALCDNDVKHQSKVEYSINSIYALIVLTEYSKIYSNFLFFTELN